MKLAVSVSIKSFVAANMKLAVTVSMKLAVAINMTVGSCSY